MSSLAWLQALLSTVVIGTIFGLISVYLIPYVYVYLAKYNDGTATLPQTRVAIAWSYVPAIWGLLLWPPLMMLQGMMGSKPASKDLTLGLLLSLAQILTLAWSMFVQVKGIAEVNRLSAWRGLGLYIVVAIIDYILVGALLALRQAIVISSG